MFNFGQFYSCNIKHKYDINNNYNISVDVNHSTRLVSAC